MVSTLSCGESLGPVPALTSGSTSRRKYDKSTSIVLSFGAKPRKIEIKKRLTQLGTHSFMHSEGPTLAEISRTTLDPSSISLTLA